MARFSSKEVEQKVLALLFKSPTHIKALSLRQDLFAISKNKNLAVIIRDFVKKYQCPPTMDALFDFANTRLRTEGDLEKVTDALELVKDLPKVEISEANYYFERAENYRIGRELYDLHEDFTNELKKIEVDFGGLREKVMKSTLFMGANDDNIRRGMIFDNVKDRWKIYRNIESGNRGKVIPFGMKKLDDILGGMRKTFLTLLYGRTGVGKTRFATNIAYNVALQGLNVMYISLEMDFDLLASVIDSRIGAINSNKIIFGKLDKDEKKTYRRVLKEQLHNHLNIWIADIPRYATMAKLLEEIEIYKSARGIFPDLVIVDYANLMEPDGRYSDRSSKFENLLKEMHQTARYYGVALITMMQESREASKEDIDQEKDKDKQSFEGVHKIGLSNYSAIHCENVIRLKRMAKDELGNRLIAIIDKSRYAAPGEEIHLFAAYDINLVGDRELINTVVRKE